MLKREGTEEKGSASTLPVANALLLGRFRQPRHITNPMFWLLVGSGIVVMLWLNWEQVRNALPIPVWTPTRSNQEDPTWFGRFHDAGQTATSQQTLVPPLHEDWHTPLPESYHVGVNPDARQDNLSVAAGKLTVSNRTAVAVYAIDSGKLLASYPLSATWETEAYNTISPAGDSYYFIQQVAQERRLAALDLSNGQSRWSRLIDNLAEEPVKGKMAKTPPPKIPFVLAPTQPLLLILIANKLTAVAQDSGKDVWQTGSLDQLDPLVQLAADNQRAYILNYGTLYTYDVASGKLLNREAGHGGRLYVADGKVHTVHGFLLTHDRTYSRAGRSLKQDSPSEWTSPEYFEMSVPVGSDELIYFIAREINPRNNIMDWSGDEHGYDYVRIFAYNLDGQEVWHSNPIHDADSYYSPPIITAQRLFYVNNGQIHAWRGIGLRLRCRCW